MSGTIFFGELAELLSGDVRDVYEPFKEKLLRVWVCPKESKSFLCSLGFCFGIEVVKNSEWACVFCTVLIWGAKPPLITAIQNTQAPSEFWTTSIPKQNPRLHKIYLDPLVNELLTPL